MIDSDINHDKVTLVINQEEDYFRLKKIHQMQKRSLGNNAFVKGLNMQYQKASFVKGKEAEDC